MGLYKGTGVCSQTATKKTKKKQQQQQLRSQYIGHLSATT